MSLWCMYVFLMPFCDHMDGWVDSGSWLVGWLAKVGQKIAPKYRNYCWVGRERSRMVGCCIYGNAPMSGEGLDPSPWYGDAVNLSPCWHGIWTDHLHRAPEPHLIGILPEQGYWLHSMWYILPLDYHHDGFIIEAPSINHDGHVASLVTHCFFRLTR